MVLHSHPRLHIAFDFRGARGRFVCAGWPIFFQTERLVQIGVGNLQCHIDAATAGHDIAIDNAGLVRKGRSYPQEPDREQPQDSMQQPTGCHALILVRGGLGALVAGRSAEQALCVEVDVDADDLGDQVVQHSQR